MAEPLKPIEKEFALWLRKQSLLNGRMDFMQEKVEGLIRDVGTLAGRIVEINEFIANHMAEKSVEAREGTEDVRAD